MRERERETEEEGEEEGEGEERPKGWKKVIDTEVLSSSLNNLKCIMV